MDNQLQALVEKWRTRTEGYSAFDDCADELAALLAEREEPPAGWDRTLEGVTVAGARAFWHAKDVEAKYEALRADVMTVVSDPYLTWEEARKALTAALAPKAESHSCAAYTPRTEEADRG